MASKPLPPDVQAKLHKHWDAIMDLAIKAGLSPEQGFTIIRLMMRALYRRKGKAKKKDLEKILSSDLLQPPS